MWSRKYGEKFFCLNLNYSSTLSFPRMKLSFYKPSDKPTQRPQSASKAKSRNELSAEARAAIKVQQRESQLCYQKDVDDAWAQIDKLTEKIATSHHKSIRRVQGALHMGHTISCAKRSKSSAWNAFIRTKSVALKGVGSSESTSTTPFPY
jgi:hypothetical protein